MLAGPTSRINLARVRYRISQGLIYLRPQRTDMLDARLRSLLCNAEFELISRLSPADRAHHVAVFERLIRLGCMDENVLKAALLHDVGKVDGEVRVGLVHRTLAVLLSALSGSLVRQVSSATGARWRRGLYLTHAHPDLGARLARDAGCNERICWLIAHHHDIDPDDEPLRMLQRVDDGRLT